MIVRFRTPPPFPFQPRPGTGGGRWGLAIFVGGLVVAGISCLFRDEPDQSTRRKKRSRKVATNHRIFISFAIEDRNLYTMFAGQAKAEFTPFSFVDMGVKEPWDESWKTQCRSRIKGCDGVIALVSRNTSNARGQLWEINCARQEKVPVLGVWLSANDKLMIPPAELQGIRIVDWTWPNIAGFVNGL
jgi:hypothetical protein